MTGPKIYPPSGWYPDPNRAEWERFWNGNEWAPAARPVGGQTPNDPPTIWAPPDSQPQAPHSPGVRQLAVIAVALLAVIGLIVEMQSVSLLTGSNTLYIGLALAIGAVVVAFVMHLHLALRIAAIAVAVICLINTISVQKQLNDKRDQLRQDLNSITGP